MSVDEDHEVRWDCYCAACRAHYTAAGWRRLDKMERTAPIVHGTLEGYRLETRRGLAHCEACRIARYGAGVRG